MNTIKLDKAEIREKIEDGNRCDGCYVLTVAPDGSDHAVHWMQDNRQWDPWPAGWLTIGIPSLYPDGEGREGELALDCLKDRSVDASKIEDATTYAWEHFAYWMYAAEDEQRDFLLSAFLAACNGNGIELKDPAPWGYIHDEYGQIVEGRDPPAEFEWLEDAP